MKDYRTILVPYDFSAHARVALELARELAERLSSKLHLVHVLETPAVSYPSIAVGVVTPGGLPVEIRDAAIAALKDVASGIATGSTPVPADVVESPSVSEAVVDFAEKISADLIVMGTHGRTGMAHAFLGSVAERTLRLAPCPVLTVRGDEEDEEDT
jgi:nucleotide-binding universal stress UspA family protein